MFLSLHWHVPPSLNVSALQQELVRLVPTLCSVGGCPQLTVDAPLALHSSLPHDVVSAEGIPSPLFWLAANFGGDDGPSATVPRYTEQNNTGHV